MAYFLEVKGRLVDVEDFRNVVVHTAHDGSRVTLGQIARIEVGAEGYGLEGYVNGAPSSSLKISQSPGSNAFDVMKAIRARIARLERDFPDDMEMDVVYDATAFVRASLKEIVATLALTCLLVAVVCSVPPELEDDLCARGSHSRLRPVCPRRAVGARVQPQHPHEIGRAHV